MLTWGRSVESFPIPFPITSIGNGKGRNEITLPEFLAAIASRGFSPWHENCHAPIFNNLRHGEIGQGFSECWDRLLMHIIPGGLTDCAVFPLNQLAA
jgi:hypothetical protein